VTYKCINFDRQDGVAHIELNRPEKANAIDSTLVAEFHDAAKLCSNDAEIRAVLLSGAGPIFCGGGDLEGFGDLGVALPSAMGAMMQDLHSATEILSTMSAPVVAAVNGMAVGGGLSLVLSSSFVVATSDARFSMGYTGAGLTPDGGATYYLPRIVGLRRAEEMMVTNRQLSAAEALDWGIVNQVVEPSELIEKAQAMAAKLAKGPTAAVGNVRRMLLQSFDNDLISQLELEGKSIVEMASTSDGQEGIRAFVEKRKPVFTGN
jgi:2-(1,2-epoxy-1,2-dihydrophenyl)acetyl-CoA isomerase